MSPRMYAGSLSVSMTDGPSGELCAPYGTVKSACVVGSHGTRRAATQGDLHAENITVLAMRSRC
jgi:hypothetical protein